MGILGREGEVSRAKGSRPRDMTDTSLAPPLREEDLALSLCRGKTSAFRGWKKFLLDFLGVLNRMLSCLGLKRPGTRQEQVW